MTFNTWFKINAKAEAPAITEVYVYGDIGEFGVTAAAFMDAIKSINSDHIDLHINSLGGESWEGVAIYNALLQHPATIDTYVDGVAASAASILALVGRKRAIGPGAMMMVHEAWALAAGSAEDMLKAAEVLDKVSDSYAQIYAAHAGGTSAKWRETMKEETWFTADEAVKAGLATEVSESEPVTPNQSLDRSKYMTAAQMRLMKADTMPENVQSADGADVTVNTADTVGDFATTVVDALNNTADGADTASQAHAVIQPVAVVKAKAVSTPYPYLLTGGTGDYTHSFLKDIESAQHNPGGAAAERLAAHETYMRKLPRSAITDANTPPTTPPTRDDLFRQLTPDPENPLSDVVTTETREDYEPFYAPHYNPAGEANLSGPYVKGVEPVIGDLGTFGQQLVEGSMYAGKTAIERSVYEGKFGPRMEALAFAAMAKARDADIEAALMALLEDLDLPDEQIFDVHPNAGTGVDAGRSIDELLDAFRTVAVRPGGRNRFSRLLLATNTHADLVDAKDSTGRRLLNLSGTAVNSDGTQDGLTAVNIAGVTGRQVNGLTTNSYWIDPNSVVSVLGRTRQFKFEYEVAWVRYGHWGWTAPYIIDTTGVVRIQRVTG